MNILDSVAQSPILKEGKVEIAISTQTIIELAISIFIAAALAILVYFLIQHANK